jgi:arylsulfatase A-like enzyme
MKRLRKLEPVAIGGRLRSLVASLCIAVLSFFQVGELHAAEKAAKPNIIFIMADDLGYGELGCYGQEKIKTPNLDRMAREGVRFTRFYAGCTVCAPSRCALMTGQDTGHCTVRGNAGKETNHPQMLRAGDVTVAEVLQQAGYATALIGKWGLGMPGDEGHPNRQGFDYFFGYLSQVHAHNHFPDYLWRNDERVPLPNQIVPMGPDGAGYATNAVQFAGDLFAREALQFIERNKDRPFFLDLSLVVPHANNERVRALKNGMEVPDFGRYKKKPWSDALKGEAAMDTRMDSDIGEILKLLKKLHLAENTLVIFTSDNGSQKEGGQDAQFFRPSGKLRGYKRDFYEGGIRVPFIAWWPRTIKPAVSDHVAYFGDIMTTFAEIAGAQPPPNLQSISFVPNLLGHKSQPTHKYLYWEFHEGGFTQAVLIGGRWKGIRLKRLDAPIMVYDLEGDPAEQTDLATWHPEIVEQVRTLFHEARADSSLWPIKEAPRSP